MDTISCRFCTASVIRRRISRKNTFPLFLHIFLTLLPCPRDRDNVHSTDEGLAVPMSYKSNNYFIISPVEAPNKPLKENQCRKNRCNSLILGLTNLLGFIVLDFLYTTQYSWVNMYFAGSSMAGLSMLLVVIKKQGGRKRNENDG